jgi:hypothetical protein
MTTSSPSGTAVQRVSAIYLPIVGPGARSGVDPPPRSPARCCKGCTMHSIRSKLIAFALLATLVPSIGLGILSFVGYRAVLDDNVAHELRLLAADAD